MDNRGGSLGSGEGRQTTVGLSTAAIFSVFAGCFFGKFRGDASVIIQRYTVRRQLFSDTKMRDLEWLFHVKYCFRAGLAGFDHATFEN